MQLDCHAPRHDFSGLLSQSCKLTLILHNLCTDFFLSETILIDLFLLGTAFFSTLFCTLLQMCLHGTLKAGVTDVHPTEHLQC